MLTAVELPRVLTPAQAAALGWTRARIRTQLVRGQWRRLPSGLVLTRPDPPTREDWIEVGLALAAPAAALTGWDAARRYGVGAFEPPEPMVTVISPRGMTRVVGGVRLRRTTRPFERRRIEFDTWAVAPARAVTDTARLYSTLRPVRALVTTAVQRRVCTVEDLVGELHNGPRRGSALLRCALADALSGARSVAEAEAVARLRTAHLPPFEVNAVVAGPGFRYVVDVLWRQLRLVLEIDSREYHFLEADWQHTLRRHNVLTAGGFAVAHYPPSVTRRAAWLAEVAVLVHARAAELGLPIP